MALCSLKMFKTSYSDFIVGGNFFVLAGSFLSRYYTFNKSILHSIDNVINTDKDLDSKSIFLDNLVVFCSGVFTCY